MGTILKLVFGRSVGTVHDISGAMVIENNLIVFLHMVNKYYETKTLYVCNVCFHGLCSPIKTLLSFYAFNEQITLG